MSSSSSTACDCFYCQYGIGYDCAYETCPFYATLGQPYVYYAQVPRNPTDRRRNPNFFVRAFRWYTQEHSPPPAQAQYTETSTSVPPADPDVVRFANWLDTKYEEFLREGRAGEEQRVVVTQTSEGMGARPQCQSQPGGNKRFTRIRLNSPWRKRRCYTNNANEGGYVPIDTNKSVVYLLEPKDLPRPISECCHVSSTPCCSVATVVKKVTCSRSATNTFTRCDVEHIDPVSVQEGIISDKAPQAIEHGCKQCPKKLSPDSKGFLSKTTSSMEKLKSKSKITGLFKNKKTENPVVLKNASCECSTLPPPKPMVDAETQYDAPANNTTAPATITPVALSEAKPKQTWFQRSLLKIPSKTLKPQRDVECQCEPEPKVNKNQYCSQCGCRCTEMCEKLLCCECGRMACIKEASALTEQMPLAPVRHTEYALKQDSLPATQQEYIYKPNVPQPVKQTLPPPPTMRTTTMTMPLQEEYAPKVDMPPIPPAKPVQQQYASKQVSAPKQNMPPPPSILPTSPSVSASKPQPMRVVSVATEPQVTGIPSQRQPASEQFMCEPPVPEKTEPNAVKESALEATSFPCTICNSVQTSDHAINLDQGTIRGYPLFLKIVCADRLNQDCLCRQ